MEQQKNNPITDNLINSLYSLPIEDLEKVEEFIMSLKRASQTNPKSWDSPDSLLNTKPIDLGPRDSTREELYESETQEIELKPKRPITDFLGILEGKIWISDDFDEPIDDMKEYME